MISIEQDLRDKIRIISDFPKDGISFKDITPLLLDSNSFNEAANSFEEYYTNHQITKVCGIESRGFLLGSVMANKLNTGFVPIRKAGKLPFETHKAEYELEYGTDIIEIHKDAIDENDTVLIHDDLLATGGTMNAAIKLICEYFQPKKIYVSFIIELSELNGRAILPISNEDIFSLIHY